MSKYIYNLNDLEDAIIIYDPNNEIINGQICIF
jgi:hypothetical protein